MAFTPVSNLFQQAHDLVAKIQADPRIQEAESRLKGKAGLDPVTIINAIVSIVMTFIVGGQGGGIEALIQMVLSFINGLVPPAPPAAA